MRVFLKLVEAGSFSRTAIMVGVTQSALSRITAQMEAVLGTRLFERSGRGIVLTESGSILRDASSEMLRRYDVARAEIKELGGTLRGECRVAMPGGDHRQGMSASLASTGGGASPDGEKSASILSHPNAAEAAKNTGGSRTVDLYFGTKAAFAIGAETGQRSRAVDENRTSTREAHARGLQRGRKLIENGNDLGQLARLAAPEGCALVAGAPGHVRGSCGPARIIAVCEM